jgi:hypothetical protein
MFSIVEKKQRRQKGGLGPLFRKELFYFILQHPSLPPLQKVFLLRLSKIATKVAHGADLLLL